MAYNKITQLAFGLVLLSGLCFGEAATTAPAPSAAPTTAAPSVFKWYGFLLPFWSVSSAGVESFSNINQGAITAAGNPVLGLATRDSTQSTFQVAQSRFGFTVTPASDLEARVEMDFIDFTKSSPTTAANPRLRRATVSWMPSQDLKFVFGQDWDLVSPLAPITYNYVGHFFEAGDIAFMRHQLQTIYRTGAWEHAMALGLPQANSASTAGPVELTLVPTISVRETYKGDGWQFGASGLIASLRASSTTTDRVTSGAVTLFGDFKVGTFEFRSEAYFGQNTVNLGMLGLSYCNASTCPQEAGAYISGRKQIGLVGLFGSLGGAAILNPGAMLSSYNASNALAGTGPGLESNWTVHFGGDHKIGDNAVIFAELSYWNTRHHLLAANSDTDPQRGAAVFQLGSQINL